MEVLMIDPESSKLLKKEIADRMLSDKSILDQLREEIGVLKNSVRRIQPRTTTSISLVATDGGNNTLQFDPFMVQIVRVVDSNNNEYCIEAITPTTDITSLSARQFGEDGRPPTALGEMMAYLEVSHLEKLSHMIRVPKKNEPVSPTWVQVYRELVEWAILFSIVRKKDFGSDTLIVFDGDLRSKAFAGNLFKRYLEGLQEGIEQQLKQHRRKIYIAGVLKHSKVLTRYRLAMMLEQILTTNYPAYVEIPRELERKAYKWIEFARGNDSEEVGKEGNKFVGGKMFFVKFGSSSRDPIWPIDIYEPQIAEAQQILGFMLADAINGFPVPLYPQCLQKAHSNAALVDFDFDIIQDQVFDGIRKALGDEAPIIDVFRLQDADPSQRRYE
jgi:hypothetical protein